MSRLNVAVIGAGSIAASHMRAYQATPDAALVGVYDIRPERTREVAEAHSIRAFDSLDDLLADPTIDAVSVCTWNDSHAEIAAKALRAGKHVLVEKPLSKTVAEAEALAAAAADSDRVLQVGFVRRFSSNARVLKTFIDAGELGEIYYARATNLRRIGNPGGWFADSARSGGGPLIDIGVHVLDLCWFMMGCPRPVTVSGVTDSRLGNRANITSLERYKVADYDPDLSDVEDLATALIRFENGSSLLLETSYSLHATDDRLEVAVFGDRGGAELEPELRIVAEKHDTVLNISPQVDFATFDFEEGFDNEIAAFVATCLGEAPLIAPVEHGVEMMRMLTAIYESAALGHEISLA
ncbi:Gfo/Idh/MocA family protein [Microbacterium sp. P07]|uniref:Gfo/Idh/MocA family protein n=1 Tax=Microbacterium sp. P07 TaxID=3366952 RepID=UPI0037461EAB